ncbi:hypothetical protein ABFP60_17310 [Clostridioides difficile]
MKGSIVNKVLGVYDLFLAMGAIYYGSLMVSGLWWQGEKFPDVWIDKVPFRSWFWPGVIAIVVYGIGNIISGIYTFSKEGKGWIASGVMGVFFFISVIASLYVLQEGYLATFQFIVLSIFQITLSCIAFIVYINNKKMVKKSNE